MKNRAKKHNGRRIAFLLTVVLITASTLTPTALVQINPKTNQPQKPPPQINPKTSVSSVRITRPPTTMNPRSLRANTRAPIAFKPLEMVDPRTGKPVTGNTMLTLDDGRTMPAAKYYEQMNKLEAGLNKFGHSFRDQQKEVVIGESAFDKERALSQIKALKSVTLSAQKAAQLDVIAQNHRAYTRTANPYFGKLPPKGATPPVTKGLFQQKVGAVMGAAGGTSTPTRTTDAPNLPKKRPDFVPGDSAVTGLGSDVETLPGVNLDPGTVPAGKRASAIQINAAWSNIGFYVNYLSAATAPLAPRYVWQVAKAGSSFDSFGAFGKTWPKEFVADELTNWKTPTGLIGSGSVSFLSPGSAPSKREHLFLIDFAKLVGNPPTKPALYLVRVIPVNANGSIAGYPSRPVIVSYGAEPPPKIVVPKPVPIPPARFPVNNAANNIPLSFGDPSIMSLELDTWMSSNGSLTSETAQVGFDASCIVLGQKFPSLLRIVGNGKVEVRQLDSEGNVTVQGSAHGDINYFVLGLSLPCEDCNRTEAASVSFPVDYKKEIDEGFTFGFPIGPIDVSGTIGFRGSIGFGGSVGVSTDGVGNPIVLQAGPHVDAHVYLEGAAGIGVGGFDVLAIGVGGEVTLISAGFVVGVQFGLHGGEYFGRISELRILDGQLYGFAKAGICPFCKKWEVKLFDWSGYDMLASNPEKMTLFAGPL